MAAEVVMAVDGLFGWIKNRTRFSKLYLKGMSLTSNNLGGRACCLFWSGYTDAESMWKLLYQSRYARESGTFCWRGERTLLFPRQFLCGQRDDPNIS